MPSLLCCFVLTLSIPLIGNFNNESCFLFEIRKGSMLLPVLPAIKLNFITLNNSLRFLVFAVGQLQKGSWFYGCEVGSMYRELIINTT